MNGFATITLVQRLRKVTYYSLTLDDQEESLFDQFIDKHASENKDKLHHIMTWVNLIGEKYGAREDYFRNEAETADASALPPKGIDREPAYIEYNERTHEDENKANDLRLYCLRASDYVVFLFNGDIKTEAKAQDCNNVMPHFRLANILTKSIDRAFIGRDIIWNTDQSDILFDEGFELNW